MSFHGTVGTGKNFVADNIANSMYKLGTQSNYVHKFMGMIDFPSKDRVDYYRVCIRFFVRFLMTMNKI